MIGDADSELVIFEQRAPERCLWRWQGGVGRVKGEADGKGVRRLR